MGPMDVLTSDNANATCCADPDITAWPCVRELQTTCYMMSCTASEFGNVHCVDGRCECDSVAHCAIGEKCVRPSEVQLLDQVARFSVVRQGAKCKCEQESVGIYKNVHT